MDQALSANGSLLTSISWDPWPAKTASISSKWTSCAQKSAPYGGPPSCSVNLVDIWLPPKLRRIGKESFLCCASLREVKIPPVLHYFAHRAFFGCEQLTQLIKLDETATWRGPHAENNAFMLCEKFKRPSWIKLLPQEEVDSDAFDEELRKGLH